MEKLDWLARGAMAAIFINAGLAKLRNRAAQEEYLRGLKVPRPEAVNLTVAGIEIAGGAALLLRVWPGLAAAGLAVYLAPVTALAHRKEPIQIMKNLAIVGGLLEAVVAEQRRAA